MSEAWTDSSAQPQFSHRGEVTVGEAAERCQSQTTHRCTYSMPSLSARMRSVTQPGAFAADRGVHEAGTKRRAVEPASRAVRTRPGCSRSWSPRRSCCPRSAPGSPTSSSCVPLVACADRRGPLRRRLRPRPRAPARCGWPSAPAPAWPPPPPRSRSPPRCSAPPPPRPSTSALLASVCLIAGAALAGHPRALARPLRPHGRRAHLRHADRRRVRLLRGGPGHAPRRHACSPPCSSWTWAPCCWP